MKIYFNAPLMGKEHGLTSNYNDIYQTIEKLGHTNLCQDVIKKSIQDLVKEPNEEVSKNYRRIVKTIKDADIVIQELSYPSLGTGYICALAVEYGKPLIAMHLPKQDLYLLRGIESDKLAVVEYTLDNLTEILKEAINFASDSMDTRFNFFVPPHISHYLDWITKHKKLPRAVFLRDLIEENMKNNKDYQS